MKLIKELNEAVNYYNSKVSEEEQLDWYDVVDAIIDTEDEEEIQQYIDVLRK